MAITHVGSTVWTISTGIIETNFPLSTLPGDLVIVTLVSKYDDATLSDQPNGWTDLGTAINTGRVPGNDNGNLKMRLFSRIFQSGDTMFLNLNPTPNNVSVVKSSVYRIATGSTFDVAGGPDADSTVGTSFAIASPNANVSLAVNDIVHADLVINGDVATWSGASTASATSTTIGTAVVNTADSSTATGTDLRMRSNRFSVTAGGHTGTTLSINTTLAGTTTNTVGVGTAIRIREITAPEPPPSTDTAKFFQFI